MPNTFQKTSVSLDSNGSSWGPGCMPYLKKGGGQKKKAIDLQMELGRPLRLYGK